MSRHFIFATSPAFGHIRPECSVACKLVIADPLILVTILAVKYCVSIVEEEIKIHQLSKEALSRISVFGVGRLDGPPRSQPGFDYADYFINKTGRAMSEAYRSLVETKRLTCTATNRTSDYRGMMPSLAVVDPYTPGLSPLIKQLTPEVRVVNFWISNACSFIQRFGPAQYNGPYEWEKETRAALERGVPEDDIQDPEPARGRLYANPESIMIYDYELTPQGDAFPSIRPFKPSIMIEAVRYVNLITVLWS